MAKPFTISASYEHIGMRLDAFLAEVQAYPSRSAAVKAIERGLVLVNGKSCSKKQELDYGDFVFCEYEQEESFGIIGQDIPLDIRFEDNDLLVLSKQVLFAIQAKTDMRERWLMR